MRNKTYKINNVNFTLKSPEDFTIDEGTELSEIFEQLSTNNSIIEIKHTAEQSKRFLAMVLQPVGDLPEGFNFGKATNKVSTEVTKDFFLSMIGLRNSTLK